MYSIKLFIIYCLQNKIKYFVAIAVAVHVLETNPIIGIFRKFKVLYEHTGTGYRLLSSLKSQV